MQRVTSESGRAGVTSIRAIRQKLQANRSQTKGSLAPLALPLQLERSAFEVRVEEERQICDRAVQRLREGASIVIDWTTRSNFRVRPELPKLKTEPIQLAMVGKNGSPSIESKRIELAKLLHERDKKYYLKSKAEQAEEATLFGVDHKMSLRNSYLQKAEKRVRRSRERRLSAKQTIESTQEHLMEHCKLTQLKGELKQKFQEIRELYNKKFDKRERFSLGNA